MPPVVREAQQSKPTDAGAAEPPPEGISQFIAKILDQLNVSSWLPGTMFVGNLALLLQLSRQGDLDVAKAAVALTNSPLGVLIVIFFGVVLAAMVAQAFAFEVIRLLEGYWGGTCISTRLLAWRTARHLDKFLCLDKRIETQTQRAFCDVARPEMLAQHVARDVVNLHEARVFRRTDEVAAYPKSVKDDADDDPWREYCAPALLRRIEAAEARRDQYPERHRILPTRLGNTLRSAEAQLRKQPGGDLEGMILRNYDRIPVDLLRKHDQFRNRLDMYCTLVFVFGVLLVVGAGLLAGGTGGLLASAGIAVGYLLLAWVSYEAAIASARGYGTVLRIIDERLADTS